MRRSIIIINAGIGSMAAWIYGQIGNLTPNVRYNNEVDHYVD